MIQIIALIRKVNRNRCGNCIPNVQNVRKGLRKSPAAEHLPGSARLYQALPGSARLHHTPFLRKKGRGSTSFRLPP